MFAWFKSWQLSSIYVLSKPQLQVICAKKRINSSGGLAILRLFLDLKRLFWLFTSALFYFTRYKEPVFVLNRDITHKILIKKHISTRVYYIFQIVAWDRNVMSWVDIFWLSLICFRLNLRHLDCLMYCDYE